VRADELLQQRAFGAGGVRRQVQALAERLPAGVGVGSWVAEAGFGEEDRAGAVEGVVLEELDDEVDGGGCLGVCDDAPPARPSVVRRQPAVLIYRMEDCGLRGGGKLGNRCMSHEPGGKFRTGTLEIFFLPEAWP
jgi:hypothetical protein